MNNMSNEQTFQLGRLIDQRDSISSAMFQIDRILKEFFPEQYALAYQHWIPQIITALDKRTDKWLPRGEYSMVDTINSISDTDNGLGTKKFI